MNRVLISVFNTRYTKGTIFLLLSLFLIQCSTSYVEGIDRAGTYEYKPGFPEVTGVSAGIVDEDTDSTFIDLTVEVVYSSLIFKRNGANFEANMLLEVTIFKDDSENELVKNYQYPLTATLGSQRAANSNQTFIFSKKYPQPPGDYRVNISVTDLSTNKQTVRSTNAYIPDPTDDISHITNVQVFTKDTSITDSFTPVTSYDLSNSTDSLLFRFQVTNNKTGEPLLLNTRLMKFRSDTSAARPLSYPNYTPSSLPYIGISYTKYEVVSTSTRLISQEGNVAIEFYFPELERGNYRFEVYTDDEDSELSLYRAREFSLKSKNYPSLRTPEELAAPLFYLMEKDDHEDLMSISDPVKLKQQIDRFWLKNIKNQRKAQNVIELYYERVEEANKQFSNYKEGWKTDMGMMYILFGPPRYVNSSINDVVWSYSTNLADPETNFLFRNPKVKSKFYPFDNYILQRNQQYFSLHYQQVQDWLSGDILRDNL
jgi:GWxTD domain-containing protein